jgi:hypothetical protein
LGATLFQDSHNLQDQYLREIGNKDPRYTGTTWLPAMLTTVWRQSFAVWSERNATIHGNTHATRQAALRRKITSEIYQWFYCRDQSTALTFSKPNLVQPLKDQTFRSPKTPLMLHLIGFKCTAPSSSMAFNSPTQLPSRTSDK